jgi:transcriptional regulator with XRE-family HTH domain
MIEPDTPDCLPPFARRLKVLREGAGLTQSQLAERAGLHLGAVFKLEQGRREPSWATVQALCVALGVSCEEFRAPAGPDQSPPTATKRQSGGKGVPTPTKKGQRKAK